MNKMHCHYLFGEIMQAKPFNNGQISGPLDGCISSIFEIELAGTSSLVLQLSIFLLIIVEFILKMEMQHTSYSSKNPMEKEIVYNSLLNASGFSDSDDEEEVSVGTHDSTLPDFDSEKGSSNKSDVESFEFTEMQSPTWKKVRIFGVCDSIMVLLSCFP